MKNLKVQPVDWSYSEKETWECHGHQFQSPININNNDTKPMNDDGELILRYRKKVNAIVNTGYSLQGYAKGIAEINHRTFEFQQFHFNAHGEHTVDGKVFPLELHLVNQSESGQIAVIGILFEIGEANPTFDELLNHVNQSDFDNHINVLSLVPKKLDYYHYLGSLTTPPLTEIVEWYVLTHPMTISLDQLNRMKLINKENFRETQDLNGRQVLKKVFE